MNRRIVQLVAITVALALGACVTERVTPKKPGQRPAPVPVSKTSPESLPTGPIAAPALNARTVNARTLVSVKPIGSVPYDGMVLPIVSPDGTRLATETGDPPNWPTLLAALGAPPSPRTRIEVYDITVSPPKAIRPRESLPVGLLLGRGADARGFLVESPQADGTRRIGRVSWADARLEWLTAPDAVNAFASMDDHSRVVCSRRTPTEAQFRLAIDGTPIDLDPGSSVIMPTFDEPSGLFAMFVQGPMGLEVQVRSASVGSFDATPTPDALQLLARRTVSQDGGAPTAYQAAEPMRGTGVSFSQYGTAPGVLMFHPGARRMVIIDPSTADLIPLAAESIAGCWAPDGVGWAVMLTTPDGLVHQRVRRDPDTGLWQAMPVARMLGAPWVARPTIDANRPFILIGPDRKKPTRVSIAAMRFADDSEEDLSGKRSR